MRDGSEAPSRAVEIDMLQALQAAISAGDLTVVERFDLPARSEHREAVPQAYRSGTVGRWLLGPDFVNGIWSHQAEALRRFEGGSNIVVATGTASGKSLVFQAAALRMLDQRPGSVVLVFYPLKALVADQLVSWRQVMAAAGMPDDAVGRLDGDVLSDERQEIMQTARHRGNSRRNSRLVDE
jgi:DEAD/DEAH box helicase domain-containing protein